MAIKLTRKQINDLAKLANRFKNVPEFLLVKDAKNGWKVTFDPLQNMGDEKDAGIHRTL